MKRRRISRREFLKLAAAAPLALSPLADRLAGATPGGLVDARPGYWADSGEQRYKRPASQTGQVSSAQPPNILIVVFDALSARNLSLYGYPRPTAPNLERLAEHALVYHQHHAAGTFTSPGAATLLTGVYPWTHRAIHLRSLALPHFSGQNLFSSLPPIFHKFAYTQNPLAFALLNQDAAHINDLWNLHQTAVFSDTFTEDLLYKDYYIASEAEDLLLKEDSDPPASLFLSLLDKLYLRRANAGLFEQNHTEYPRGLVNCREGNPGVFCFTLEQAIDWTLNKVKSAPQPFCGYVHAFPPHAPYNPRFEFTRLFGDDIKVPNKPDFGMEASHNPKTLARYRRFYDQTIAYVDAEFDRLLSGLKDAGALENTVVVFTSDHGEMLERGVWGHTSEAMYEPLAHIPLVAFLPGQTSRQDIFTPTSAADLLPSLLELSGAPAAESEGRALPGLSASAPAEGRTLFVMDAKTNPKRGPLNKASLAALNWPFKLIRYQRQSSVPDGFEMYDLSKDPEEMKNIYAPDLSEAKRLREELEGQLEAHGTVG